MATSTVERLAYLRQILSNGEARALREQADVSRGEIARELGVAESTIRRWEVGERRPTGSTALAYLELLDRLKVLTKTAA